MIVDIVKTIISLFQRYLDTRRQQAQDALTTLEGYLPVLEEISAGIYKLLFPNDYSKVLSENPDTRRFPFTKKLSNFGADNKVLAGALLRLEPKKQQARFFSMTREYLKLWKKYGNRFGSRGEPELPPSALIFQKVAIRFGAFLNGKAIQ